MRQNLTNVKETQLDKVDSFYIVGSTTKEGLIEGRSNVKIDLKKAIAEGGGGGSSSEDAQKLFEMFFGQMPYVYVEGSEPLPITEYSIEELTELGSASLIYKKQEPVSKANRFDGGENLVNIGVVSATDIGMYLVPVDIPNGPWYYPAPVPDIDLSLFELPTEGNPTILTGIEIPQSEILPVLQDGNIALYYWDENNNRYIYEQSGGFYTISYYEDSWIWKFDSAV